MSEQTPTSNEQVERSRFRERAMSANAADQPQMSGGSNPVPAGRVDHGMPVHECADRRVARRTDRLRGSRAGSGATRRASFAGRGAPVPDRPVIPQSRRSKPSSERPLRRWSVAELLAGSHARPDDDLSEPWARPRAS